MKWIVDFPFPEMDNFIDGSQHIHILVELGVLCISASVCIERNGVELKLNIAMEQKCLAGLDWDNLFLETEDRFPKKTCFESNTQKHPRWHIKL